MLLDTCDDVPEAVPPLTAEDDPPTDVVLPGAVLTAVLDGEAVTLVLFPAEDPLVLLTLDGPEAVVDAVCLVPPELRSLRVADELPRPPLDVVLPPFSLSAPVSCLGPRHMSAW